MEAAGHLVVNLSYLSDPCRLLMSCLLDYSPLIKLPLGECDFGASFNNVLDYCIGPCNQTYIDTLTDSMPNDIAPNNIKLNDIKPNNI